MNQWKAEEAILEKIKSLARTYTPEWEFSTENPDAGSVIARIFAKQMSRNVARADESLPWYRESMIRMLGLSPLPPEPAAGTVVLELASDVIDGVYAASGTRLRAENEEGKEIIFETVQPVYVTNSHLTDILEISQEQGKIIPHLGRALLMADGIEEGGQEAARAEDFGPVRLFGFEGDDISRCGLLICHETLFDASEEIVYVRITGTGPYQDLFKQLSDPQSFAFYGCTAGGFKKLTVSQGEGGTLVIRSLEKFSKLPYEGREYGMLYIKALKPVEELLNVRSLELSGAPCERRPDFLGCGEEELAGDRIYPFGNQLELYKEFLIGCDPMFKKAGARISLSFTLSYEEREIRYDEEEEDEELKPVMRRTRSAANPVRCRARAETVTVSYYNGAGWRRLSCEEEPEEMFGGGNAGKITMTFTCPDDWEETAEGGYVGRLLRFVVTKADHCYYIPTVHLLPVISEPVVSCSYEGIWLAPDRVAVMNGTDMTDRTRECLRGKGFPAFAPIQYEGGGLYLGFDRKLQEGPVSLFFNIREDTYLKPVKLRYEYSASHGFRKLSVEDGTGSMTDSGPVRFFPPSDFAELDVAGQKRYWIRLMQEEGGVCHPWIDGILINAAEIRNVETGEEETYYLDEPTPGLEIHLGKQPVLSALVYVNENSSLSAAAKRQLLESQPERVRTEQDYRGEISSFFIRWEETEDLRYCGPGERCYQLDRQKNVLRFGDGVHGRMPSERQDAAFTVSVRGCVGQEGNVPAGAVDTLLSHLLFIGQVRNPDSTHGGSDVEHAEHMLRRGTNLISTGGRLVSGPDYVREALLYSGHISQAVLKPDGQGMRLVLLMKDYTDGSDSFNQVKAPLKRWLLERGEIGWDEAALSVMEPEFVSLNVKVWIRLRRPGEAFAVREQIEEAVKAFIEPVSSDGYAGRPIGSLPRENQFQVMLQSIRFDGYLEHFIVTACWKDEGGSHESDLKRFAGHPFAVGVNGRHEIYLQSEKW